MTRTSDYRILCRTLAIVAVLAVAAAANADSVTSACIYQGRLKTAGAGANGPHDMRFRLYNALSGGAQVGTSQVHDGNFNPVVDVAEGLFAVKLNFGTVFDGTAVWLEIDVRPDNVGSYTTLAPRQPLCATPYAAFALNSPGWTLNGTDAYHEVGNVGIGLSPPDVPQAPLHVAGPIYSRGGTTNGFWAYNPNLEAASVSLGWLDDVARIRIGGNNPGSQNGFAIQKTGDATILRLLDNGNLGLGTVSPDVKLHVAGGSDVTLAGGGSVQAGSSNSLNLAFDENEIMARNNGAASALSLNNEGGDLYLIPNGGGQVGIGTSTPAALIDVESALPNEVIGRFVKTSASNTDGVYVETNGSPVTGGALHAVNLGPGAAVWAQNNSGGVTTALVAQRPLSSAGAIAEFRVGNTVRAYFAAPDGDLHFPLGADIHLGNGNVRFSDASTALRGESASVVVDPPSLTTGGSTVITVAVPGAAVGDAVVANPGANFSLSYAISFVRVSANDTVSVGLINPSPSTVNPSSSTWQFRIIK